MAWKARGEAWRGRGGTDKGGCGMMQASLHGRLGKDALAIATRTGNPMAAASVAGGVSTKAVGGRDDEATP